MAPQEENHLILSLRTDFRSTRYVNNPGFSLDVCYRKPDDPQSGAINLCYKRLSEDRVSDLFRHEDTDITVFSDTNNVRYLPSIFYSHPACIHDAKTTLEKLCDGAKFSKDAIQDLESQMADHLSQAPKIQVDALGILSRSSSDDKILCGDLIYGDVVHPFRLLQKNWSIVHKNHAVHKVTFSARHYVSQLQDLGVFPKYFTHTCYVSDANGSSRCSYVDVFQLYGNTDTFFMTPEDWCDLFNQMSAEISYDIGDPEPKDTKNKFLLI